MSCLQGNTGMDKAVSCGQMNYLSHYYIDYQHPSIYYKLGVVLPDLYRNFNADLRKPMFSSGIVWNNEHLQLVGGVKKHYYVDGIFHNLQKFKYWMDCVGSEMDSAGLVVGYPRRFFLSHIWVEWLIDRWLVKEKREVAERFYVEMDEVDEEVVKRFFGQMDRAEQGDVFFAKFRLLIQNRYLFLYPDNEKFTRALMNVYQNTVKAIVPASDYPRLLEVNLRLEQSLSPQFNDMFIHLNSLNHTL